MTNISSKLIAVAAALIMSSLIMGAVGFLFELQSRPHLTLASRSGYPVQAIAPCDAPCPNPAIVS